MNECVFVKLYLTKGTLCGWPREGTENMERTFPNSLRRSLINLSMIIWNLKSSQIVAQAADQFRGHVTVRANTREQRSCLS